MSIALHYFLLKFLSQLPDCLGHQRHDPRFISFPSDLYNWRGFESDILKFQLREADEGTSAQEEQPPTENRNPRKRRTAKGVISS